MLEVYGFSGAGLELGAGEEFVELGAGVDEGVDEGVGVGAGAGEAGDLRRRNRGRRKEVRESKSLRRITPTPWVVSAERR